MRVAAAPEPPVIETARLVLRPHRWNDLDTCVAMWSDSEATRYIHDAPATQRDVWLRILLHATQWRRRGFGYWAVGERASGSFVGELGFAKFDVECAPEFDGIPKAGCIFVSSVHGKGYAREAFGPILAWADANIEVDRTVTFIDEANGETRRMARRCGFELQRQYVVNGVPTLAMVRSRGRRD